jgi:serpin B
MRRRTLVGTVAAAGLLTGCSGGSSAAPATYVTARYAATVAVDEAAYQQAETGSESFGLALLSELGDEAGSGDNVVFSPQTLVTLLAMLLPGATGQTATQLSDALGDAGLTASTTAGALGRLNATARADANQGSNTLDESGDVWTASGLKLAQDYLAALAGAFGTGVHQTDFASDPRGSAQAIDDLVSQQTHGYIPQLFAPSAFDASTRLVLTDAAYLDASWAARFSPDKTSAADFYLADGSTAKTPMMSQTGEFKYASGDGWQLVEMPYAGGRTAMDILLPAKGSRTLPTLRDGLSATSLNSMLSSMTEQRVTLTIPKFTASYSPADLMRTLTKLDLDRLFTNADLTGITADHEKLAVAQIVEKAYVAVGEQGTVAAAAAGGAVGTAAQAPGTPFDADHPLLYLVRDVSTGQLLFTGQLVTP